MIEQHLNGRCQLRGVELVDSVQNPNCFNEGQKGDPCAVFDKGIGRSSLTKVVTGDEADEDFRINGAHGVYERGGEGLL